MDDRRDVRARLACRVVGSAVFGGSRSTSGQTTVEAAFLLPVLFLSLLILLQPALLLYDRIVMEGAASRAARLAATASSAAVERGTVEEIARTYLGAIPPVGIFHVHEGGCSYEITVLGDESSEEVTVDIVNKVDPLPLIGIGAAGLGLTDGSGRFTVEVSATEPTQPDWVWDSGAGAPGDWAGRWM